MFKAKTKLVWIRNLHLKLNIFCARLVILVKNSKGWKIVNNNWAKRRPKRKRRRKIFKVHFHIRAKETVGRTVYYLLKTSLRMMKLMNNWNLLKTKILRNFTIFYKISKLTLTTEFKWGFPSNKITNSMNTPQERIHFDKKLTHFSIKVISECLSSTFSLWFYSVFLSFKTIIHQLNEKKYKKCNNFKILSFYFYLKSLLCWLFLKFEFIPFFFKKLIFFWVLQV